MAFSANYINNLITNKVLRKINIDAIENVNGCPETETISSSSVISNSEKQESLPSIASIASTHNTASVASRIDQLETEIKMLNSKTHEIKQTFDAHSKNVADILNAFELKFNDYISELDKLKQSFFTETNTLLIHNTTEINNINSILKQNKILHYS